MFNPHATSRIAVTDERKINRKYCTDKIHTHYAHVGLFDVSNQQFWIAKKKPWGTPPIRVSHARLLRSGTHDASTADKDRFICTWFHPPNTGQGHIHGYPIEWEEGHVLIRMDPRWNYQTRQLIATTDTTKIDRNIDKQYDWGRKILSLYLDQKPRFPLSWHMVGPRARDSMFYIERIELSTR